MQKQILVLGGTGAMGRPLVNILKRQGLQVTVTSRKERQNEENLTYRQGNAHDDTFLRGLLAENSYDAVVDFMVYNTDEFAARAEWLLDSTKQYVFISSARVYNQSDSAITETTPRLLDSSTDEEYLKTDEYALTKARQENILLNSVHKNWTIVRPSITYNDYRLQLGTLEKENWLYRALHGRSIVFSKDVANKITTNTWGEDVAQGIGAIVAKKEACGEVFHITEPYSHTWQEVLEVYLEVLEKKTGRRPKVVMTEKSDCLAFPWRRYQLIYSRYFNRHFDSSKIGRFLDINDFKDICDGLGNCLEQFLNNPSFDNIDWMLEAMLDRSSCETTPLAEIAGYKNKIKYVLYRYQVPLLLELYKMMKK